MLTLPTVESQGFRRLIGGLSSTNVPDRKTPVALNLDKVFLKSWNRRLKLL